MENFSVVKVLAANYITHDVKRFVVEKPGGFHFTPGQNVLLAINAEGWETAFRPFSFTSLSDWPYLEFIIKIYNDRNGVTKELGKTNAGAELIIQKPYGTITFKGPGVFIAGGSGVTPFISILRDLYFSEFRHNSKLILSNKSAEDIILPYELNCMLGRRFMNVFTRQGVIGYRDRRIDRNLLIRMVEDFSGHFYLCGPEDFVETISGYLISLGADAETIIFEKGV